METHLSLNSFSEFLKLHRIYELSYFMIIFCHEIDSIRSYISYLVQNLDIRTEEREHVFRSKDFEAITQDQHQIGF